MLFLLYTFNVWVYEFEYLVIDNVTGSISLNVPTVPKAEISFVVQDRNGKIMPMEVVNMKLTKAKAMSLFTSKFNIPECIRFTEDNFSKKKGVRLIPVYAACYIKEL